MMKVRIALIMVFGLVAGLSAIAGFSILSAGRGVPARVEEPVPEAVSGLMLHSEPVEIPFPQVPQDEHLAPGELVVLKKKDIPEYPYKLPEWRGKLKKLLEKPIRVRFSDTPFDYVIAEVARKVGIRILVDKTIDTESYTVSLRLKDIRAKNALTLVLAVEPDIAYELMAPGAVRVRFKEDINAYAEEEILSSIESARHSLAYEEKWREALSKVNSTTPREFDWTDKTTDDAVAEVCKAFKLKLINDFENFRDQFCVNKCDLWWTAPRGTWKGNAPAALKHLLKRIQLDYEVWCEGNRSYIAIVKWPTEKAELRRERLEAFGNFASKRVSGRVENEPLHKLIDRLQWQTGVPVYPDKGAWEAGVKLTLESEKPTVKQLLDYLQTKHAIKHWFEVDSETGAESFFLLKSQ